MRSILLVLLVFFGYNPSNAQRITHEKTFELAQEKSKETGKPLFIYISKTPPAGISNYISGFSSPEVVTLFKESFISFRTSYEEQASSLPLIKRYSITSFPAFVFIDSKGGVIFKDFGTSTLPDKYLRMAQRAMEESKEKSIIQYDNEYAFGNRDTAFLKKYISKRKKAGVNKNSALIEEYVQQLSISDLEDYHLVLFILEAGPAADSKAYRLAHTNRKIIDRIYKSEPLAKRTSINNTIINNTMAEAIALKSISKLEVVVNFVRGTWTNNYHEGQKNSTYKYLQYYKAVKDTSQYLMRANNYYEQYYMYLSADSIKKLDQKRREIAKNNAIKEARASGKPAGVISVTYSQNAFSTELNNGAYSIFETGTQNVRYLTAALLWSKRSIELNPQAGFYDTLAHLLYRLGFYSEALSTQEKAVELAKSNKQPLRHLQDELAKIKKRIL